MRKRDNGKVRKFPEIDGNLFSEASVYLNKRYGPMLPESITFPTRRLRAAEIKTQPFLVNLCSSWRHTVDPEKLTFDPI